MINNENYLLQPNPELLLSASDNTKQTRKKNQNMLFFFVCIVAASVVLSAKVLPSLSKLDKSQYTCQLTNSNWPVSKKRVASLLGGPGKTGPVVLGNATLQHVYAFCNDVTGCTEWRHGWNGTTYYYSQMYPDSGLEGTSLVSLGLRVDSNQLELGFYSSYSNDFDGDIDCFQAADGNVFKTTNLTMTAGLTAAGDDDTVSHQPPNEQCYPLQCCGYWGGSSTQNIDIPMMFGVMTDSCASFSSPMLSTIGPGGGSSHHIYFIKTDY